MLRHLAATGGKQLNIAARISEKPFRAELPVRDLLAPIHGCFTERFDTRGLKEAAALLAVLA
jgi:hypothetical protein